MFILSKQEAQRLISLLQSPSRQTHIISSVIMYQFKLSKVRTKFIILPSDPSGLSLFSLAIPVLIYEFRQLVSSFRQGITVEGREKFFQHTLK